MKKVPTLQDVLGLVERLSILEKVRLIEQVAPQIEHDLLVAQQAPRKSLYGLCADLGPAPSAEVIDETRCEAWDDFPREDV